MKSIYQKLILLLGVAGVISSCNEAQREKVFHTTKTPITRLTPTSIEFPQSYVADVQAIQFVEVKPKVEGFVQQILVDEGEKVQKGRPLFRLSSEEYSVSVKEAQANYKQSEAELQMAEYEAERIERLVKKNILSKIRLDQVMTQIKP